MNKKATIFFLVSICIFLNTLAQFFLKIASKNFDFNIFFFFNINLILGSFFYAMSLVFFLYLLKQLELSIAVPLLSLQYIFITLISSYLFHETITLMQVVGLILIMFGVTAIVQEVKS